MAVPKKRTGHSAQGKRRSNWKATRPEVTTCPNCGAAVLTHTVCTACGTYKGKAVRLKDKAEEAKAAEKKPAVKTTKKAKTEKVVEEKVETTVVEEVKEAPVEAKAEETKEEVSEATTETEEK